MTTATTSPRTGPRTAPQTAPRIAVVVVNYRTPELAIRCAEAVADERETGLDIRLVVADGGSADGSAETIAAALAGPRFVGWATTLPLAINGGFGWANNQAILTLMQEAAPPEFIHILNPDAVAEPGAIGALARTLADHPGCGAAGSALLDGDGRPATSAFRFPTPPREFMRGCRTGAIGRLLGIDDLAMNPAGSDAAGEVDWVSGASVMFRTAALRDSRLFDDGFFLYFEEVELMHRLARAGWRTRHVPESCVRHIGGASTGVLQHGDRSTLPRRPGYYYTARRRFFARAGGCPALADIAFLAGHAIWRLRLLVRLARPSNEIAGEAADTLRAWLRGPASAPASTPPLEAPPGSPPAWMEHGR